MPTSSARASSETLGIPIVRGRDFTPGIRSRPPVAIVSETTAGQFFPARTRSAALSFDGPRTVRGARSSASLATANTRALGEGPVRGYLPLAQQHETGMTLYVRTSVPPGALVAAVRREIQALEPNLPVPNIQTMTQTIGTSLYAPRMGAVLLVDLRGAGAAACVARRLRCARFLDRAAHARAGDPRRAGANHKARVFSLVIREGMWLVGIGLVIGLAAGLAGARLLGSFLYGVTTTDPLTFLLTTALLATVSVGACAIPARRAMRVAPIRALREG